MIIELIFSTFFLTILTFFLIGIIWIFWTITRSQKEIAKEYLKILEEQEPLRKRIQRTKDCEFSDKPSCNIDDP
ncbi:hypothetical protein BpHYR1_045942 [Brachionus plicatilis]|uniref:Uncharacterized protein n=1 Tax=Brachionus plicatilis TaxID=10195 RepID=A0A3M7T6X8_BRAPC|nr:hypothetical protein BpHYR1_045942 [Brachionus plicatilis]